MKKTILSAAALSLFLATAAFAQTTPTTKSDGDKMKTTTADGMTVKTKMADDGKMKMKGKDEAGNSVKSTTKPRKGDMSMEGGNMSGDMKMHKGMHHKGMRKDSMKMKMKADKM